MKKKKAANTKASAGRPPQSTLRRSAFADISPA
jgi:hypothetical protein